MTEVSSIESVRDAIKKAERILVLSHYNPDPDAFGASLGMTLALKKMGKEAVCLNVTGPNPRYAFMPGMEEILSTVPAGEWDAVIACDCADKGRIGEALLAGLPQRAVMINIDHHISNDFFGDVNCVDAHSSSASELVLNVLRQFPDAISREAAICLLAGIYGDTGSFRYASTCGGTFLAAHELCVLGASPYDIALNLYSDIELSALKLQTAALSNVQLHFGGRVAEVLVTKELLESCGADIDDAEVLAERARDIAGVDIAFSIRRDNDIWRVSLRSKHAKYNVSEIAAKFGGGGHAAAAAFRSRKPLEEVREKLLAAIGEEMGTVPVSS